MKARRGARWEPGAQKMQVILPMPKVDCGWSQESIVTSRPQRTFDVVRFSSPVTCMGWQLLSLRVGTRELLAFPVDLGVFSDLAVGVRAPELQLSPRTPLVAHVRSPKRPKAAHWSFWRVSREDSRHGLRVLRGPTEKTRRKGLTMLKATRPHWLPLPRPYPFSFAAVGEVVVTLN